ncbi:hypothetical protein NPX13_g5848 [Xylaria arbuscula]|uniref:Uncharacterized protein n=1 Tax=Xylaria arbuscula TaxID=114810 RepID=A0A9W8NDD4_9PEZI|nr:hypothetical protein NPX13_g5848 [Xylaria arbuscula]
MSFRSSKPTPESQTVLQLQWDCRQNKGVAWQLTNSWIAGTDGTVLNEEERRMIAKTLRMETPEVTRKVESLLRIDLVHFERVRSQLLSLLISWEQAIWEKKRYDEEGLRTGNNEAQLNPHQFMILFQTIYFRARAGLTSLPTSTTSSSGMVASIKYSSKPDSSATTKQPKLENADRDRDRVKTCNKSLADMSSLNPATNCHLTRLPVEMKAEILSHLPNLRALLSAILAHTSLYATYKECSRSILLAVFRRRCRAIRGCEIGEAYLELVFAIRHDFVSRDVVKELFTYAWGVFRTRHVEDLLLPLGRALALTYRRDRRTEAVHLLRELAILSLLRKWEEAEASDYDRWSVPEDRRIFDVQQYIELKAGDGIYTPFVLARIQGTSFRAIGGDALTVILENGMYFDAVNRLILVVLVNRDQTLPWDLNHNT